MSPLRRPSHLPRPPGFASCRGTRAPQHVTAEAAPLTARGDHLLAGVAVGVEGQPLVAEGHHWRAGAPHGWRGWPPVALGGHQRVGALAGW